MNKLTLNEGELLVRIAREAIEVYLEKGEIYKPKNYPAKFNEERGVFVTLETYPGKDLRGCIGYPEPIKPLIEALIDSAISAATRDPRFPPVTLEELDNLIIEVSVLTKPELLKCKPNEYKKFIEIGKHGLIVEKGIFRGLLLPQVAVEYNWDVEEFLANTCLKAGLLPDEWLDDNTNVYIFEAQIFSELKPNGEVIERKLK